MSPLTMKFVAALGSLKTLAGSRSATSVYVADGSACRKGKHYLERMTCLGLEAQMQRHGSQRDRAVSVPVVDAKN